MPEFSSNSWSFLSFMAIGDAFGMKYEFVEHDVPVSAADLFYGPHPTFKEYQVGRYTDDTQMSLVNAEPLIAKEAKKINRDDFVATWIYAFSRDPRVGCPPFIYYLHLAIRQMEKRNKTIDYRLGALASWREMER